MNIQDIFAYLFVELFCLLLSFSIFFKMDRSRGSEDEIRSFRWVIIILSIYFVCDSLTILGENKIIPFSNILSTIINGLDLLLLGILCFLWFLYFQFTFDGNIVSHRILFMLSCMPLALSIVLCVCSVKTGWIYYVNADGVYHRGDFYFIQIAVDYFYYILCTIFAIYSYFKVSDRLLKYKAIAFTIYIFIPFVGGWIQIFLPGTPIIAMSMFLTMFFAFIYLQNLNMFKDALTGLNNRRRAEIFIQNMGYSIDLHHSEYLFLFDVNTFKQINDNFGHMEGDNALKYTADALKCMADLSSGFLARYGGDEFLLLVQERNITSPEAFISKLRGILHEICQSEKLKYEITLSIGYAKIDDYNTDFSNIFNVADNMLYEDKRQFHQKTTA